MRKLLIIFFIIMSCTINSRKDENDVVINFSHSFEFFSNSVLDTSLNRLLYEGLTRKDETGNIVPGLAERWEKTPDGRKWTFYLRDGIKYSDGSPVSAEDFLYSWSNGKHTGNSFSDGFSVITVIDDKTLEIELLKDIEKDHGDFLEAVSKARATPRKKGYPLYGYNYRKMKASEIYSTGPYTLKEWKEDRIVLERNNLYWDSKSIKSKKIILKYEQNLSFSLKEFEKGNTDLTEIREQDAEKYKNSAELNTVETNRALFLLFNGRSQIMRNKNMKRAVLMAIEREEDVPENYISGYKKFSNLSKKIPSSVFEYNPLEAKKILANETGNVNSASEIILLSYNPENRKKALKIKEDLKKNLGLKIKIIWKYDKKYENSYDLKLEYYEKNYFYNNRMNFWTSEENNKLISLFEKAEANDSDESEKIKALYEIDRMYAEKIPYAILDNKVYRYFLINDRAKGISVESPHGEIILNNPFIEK